MLFWFGGKKFLLFQARETNRKNLSKKGMTKNNIQRCYFTSNHKKYKFALLPKGF